MLETDEVVRNIHNAMTNKDREALWRGLDDLVDSGATKIEVHLRHITHKGTRLLTTVTYPEQKVTLTSPDKKLTMADKLFIKLRWVSDLKRLENKEQPIYFKHENDMSPEEYAWVMEI